jgi:hypothetical protein
MKKLLLILAVSVLLMAQGCSWEKEFIDPKSSFNELSVLEGRWKMKLEEGSSIEEVWKKENDTLYKGYSYEVNKGDTVITELIDLYVSNLQIFYVPTTYGQNDGNPVAFKLTSREGGVFNFTNPDHDFPNLISYSVIDRNHIIATVSGDVEGTTRALDFDYYRQ